MRINFENYENNLLQKIISESTSISEVLRKLDLPDRGAPHVALKMFLKTHPEFNTTTLVGRRIKRYDNTGIPKKLLSEMLVENGSGNSNSLKKRLIKEGVKEEMCEICHNSEWMGDKIPLDLHHINGNHFDNRLENLIILCPNCHRMTKNWGGKESSVDLICKQIAEQTAEEKIKFLLEREEKRKEEIYQNKLKWGEIRKIPIKEKVIKYCEYCGTEIIGRGDKFCSIECYNADQAKNVPSKEDLLIESFNHKSLESMAKKYNVSGNACKKWLKRYGIYNEVKSNFKQKTYPIYQYDLDGNFIREWKDGDEIVNVLGFNKSKIHNVCRKCQKTSNGYIWKYKKDVENK